MNLPFAWQSVLTNLSSVHLCPYIHLCNLIHLSIHLYTFLFVYPSLVNCLSLQLIPSVYPSIYLPICLCISIYLYVYLSPLSYCLSPHNRWPHWPPQEGSNHSQWGRATHPSLWSDAPQEPRLQRTLHRHTLPASLTPPCLVLSASPYSRGTRVAIWHRYKLIVPMLREYIYMYLFHLHLCVF